MFDFFNVFSIEILLFCAGCAGLCAGFVQGLEMKKSFQINGIGESVQGVHGFFKIPLRVRAGTDVHTRTYTYGLIFFKPCTACTIKDNFLKITEKIKFKPCTNPAQYPAHPAQLIFFKG